MMDWNKITENTNLRCSYITMPTCHIWHDIKSGFPQNNGEKQVNEVLIQVESTIYKWIFLLLYLNNHCLSIMWEVEKWMILWFKIKTAQG